MTLTTIADLIFAGGVVLAALALAGAALRRASTSALASVAALEAVAAVGVWVAFALRHGVFNQRCQTFAGWNDAALHVTDLACAALSVGNGDCLIWKLEFRAREVVDEIDR